jgi:SAM-dependent methyltransferase
MSQRIRPRQGSAVILGGVPYSDGDTTLSLLPGAAVGEWLERHRNLVRGDLLDLGCGNQPYRAWYQPLVSTVTTLDAAPSPGVELDLVAFADDVPLASASFDIVIATEILEHVGDAEAAMSEIFRLLRPGGHAIVTTPFLYPTHEAPHDYRRFTHHGLVSLAERHGLQVIDVGSKGGLLVLVAQYVVLAAVEGSAWLSTKLNLRKPLAEYRFVRWFLAAPQRALIRRRSISRPVRGLSTRLSLGYLLVCEK